MARAAFQVCPISAGSGTLVDGGAAVGGVVDGTLVDGGAVVGGVVDGTLVDGGAVIGGADAAGVVVIGSV